MQLSLYCISFLFLVACTSVKQVHFHEINYGLSKSEILYRVDDPNEPSGYRNITSPKLNVIQTTDTIKAISGNQFGVEYEVRSPSNKKVTLTIKWTYPSPMKTVSGPPVDFSVSDHRVRLNEYSYNNYTLGLLEEGMPGEWIYEVWYKNQQLYKRSFYLKSK